MRLCHFEDRRTADLGPLTLTRPASDLLCGMSTLGVKQRQYFEHVEVVGHLCRTGVAGAVACDPNLVNNPIWLRSAPTVVVNGRWLPPTRTQTERAPSFKELFANGSFLALCGEEVAFAVLDPALLSTTAPETIDERLENWMETLPCRTVGGQMIRYPWELVDRNAEQIIRGFDSIYDASATGFHPNGFLHVGPADRLLIDPSAEIEPLVVADTTHGPVIIGPGTHVHAFTRLEGPCVIGAGSHVLGARIRAGTTIGPDCRVGGEVECSILHGHVNKYHDGFLGHSYVGEWVNLAAGTITSDLRNDYQPINVPINGVEVPTGLTKVGSFIGDHARTGLNVILNCGSVIGAFANLLPTGQFAPQTVPSFSRFGPHGLKPNSDIEKTLATADRVMHRRGKSLTAELEAVYRRVADNSTLGFGTGLRLRKSA